MFQNPQVLSRNQPYPIKYLEPLKSLWKDAGIQAAKEKGNMFALHDNAS